MWLGGTIQPLPLLIGQDPIPFVVRIRKGNFRRWIALEKTSANGNVKAMLEGYVVMVDCLHAGWRSIGFLSLRSERFDLLRLDVGEQLSAEERNEVGFNTVGTTNEGAEGFDLL